MCCRQRFLRAYHTRTRGGARTRPYGRDTTVIAQDPNSSVTRKKTLTFTFRDKSFVSILVARIHLYVRNKQNPPLRSLRKPNCLRHTWTGDEKYPPFTLRPRFNYTRPALTRRRLSHVSCNTERATRRSRSLWVASQVTIRNPFFFFGIRSAVTNTRAVECDLRGKLRTHEPRRTCNVVRAHTHV